MEPTRLVAAFHEVEVACQPVSSPGFGAVPARRLIRVPLGGPHQQRPFLHSYPRVTERGWWRETAV
jgi:hypothetical protein